MSVERASGALSFLDVLDRVLDKGIVIDWRMRVSLIGIDLVTVRGRAVVASIDTYMKHSAEYSQARAPSELVSRHRRTKSAVKDRRSPPWLYDLLEGLGDGPSSRGEGPTRP